MSLQLTVTLYKFFSLVLDHLDNQLEVYRYYLILTFHSNRLCRHIHFQPMQIGPKTNWVDYDFDRLQLQLIKIFDPFKIIFNQKKTLENNDRNKSNFNWSFCLLSLGLREQLWCFECHKAISPIFSFFALVPVFHVCQIVRWTLDGIVKGLHSDGVKFVAFELQGINCHVTLN